MSDAVHSDSVDAVDARLENERDLLIVVCTDSLESIMTTVDIPCESINGCKQTLTEHTPGARFVGDAVGARLHCSLDATN